MTGWDTIQSVIQGSISYMGMNCVKKFFCSIISISIR